MVTQKGSKVDEGMRHDRVFMKLLFNTQIVARKRKLQKGPQSPPKLQKWPQGPPSMEPAATKILSTNTSVACPQTLKASQEGTCRASFLWPSAPLIVSHSKQLGMSSFSELQSKYDLLGMIGQGSFATVLRARVSALTSDDELALKICRRCDAVQEGWFQAFCGHSNIVAVLDGFMAPHYTVIVMPMADATLNPYVEHSRTGGMSPHLPFRPLDTFQDEVVQQIVSVVNVLGRPRPEIIRSMGWAQMFDNFLVPLKSTGRCDLPSLAAVKEGMVQMLVFDPKQRWSAAQVHEKLCATY